jgi:hypothetical protein
LRRSVVPMTTTVSPSITHGRNTMDRVANHRTRR